MMTFSKNFPLKLTLDLGTDKNNVQRSSEVKKSVTSKAMGFSQAEEKMVEGQKSIMNDSELMDRTP